MPGFGEAPRLFERRPLRKNKRGAKNSLDFNIGADEDFYPLRAPQSLLGTSLKNRTNLNAKRAVAQKQRGPMTFQGAARRLFCAAALILGLLLGVKVCNELRMTRMYERQAAALERIAHSLDGK